MRSDGSSEFLKARDGLLPLDADGFPIIADERSETHTGLIVVHYFFVFLHNIFAAALKKTCVGLSDELIWEKAKQINIAVYQRTLYDGILPSLFGFKFSNNRDLRTTTDSFNAKTVPQAMAEYASAGGRAQHEFIPGKQY